jgi:chitinase
LISASPDDTENFTLLLHDIRQEIGDDKLLTFASSNTARYVDWKTAEPYLDLINIMSYDLENKGFQERGEPVYHHSPLFRSQYTPRSTVEDGINAHLEAGIPPHKIVLGIAFSSKGLLRGVRYDNLDENSNEYTIQWDNDAKAAWLSDKEGNFIQTYEEPRAIAYKCEYLHSKGLRGAMYWQYTSDVKGDLRKAVYEGVMNKNIKAE